MLLGSNMTEPRKYKFVQCSDNNEFVCPHSTQATSMSTPILQKTCIERQSVQQTKWEIWGLLIFIPCILEPTITKSNYLGFPTHVDSLLNSRYKHSSTELTSNFHSIV